MKFIPRLCLLVFFFCFSTMSMAEITPDTRFETEVTSRGNQYWTNVSLSIKNISKDTMDIKNLSIQLTLPKAISSANGEFPPSLSYADILIDPKPEEQKPNSPIVLNLSFPSGDWVKSKLGPDEKFTINFGLDHDVDNQIIKDSVKIYTDNPPACDGKITVTAPSKPGDKASSQATAFLQASSYSKDITLDWGKSLTLENLCYKSYTLFTNTAGIYPPGDNQTIVLNQDKSQVAVTLKYGQPVQKLILKIKPSSIVNGLPLQKVYLNSMGSDTAQDVQWNTENSIELVEGKTYTIWMNEFYFEGRLYTPLYTKDKPKTLSNIHEDMSLDLAFTATTMNKVALNLSVSPKDSTAALPSDFTSEVTAVGEVYNQTYTCNLRSSGCTLNMIPDTYEISAKSFDTTDFKYMPEINKPILVEKDTSLEIKVNRQKNDRLMVGYLTATWNAALKISDAAKAGYNVVVVAFAVEDGNSAYLYGNQFIAYTHWEQMSDNVVKDINNDILDAKKNNGLKYVLASYGGESNTFQPGTNQDVKTIAKQMIELNKTFGFDGIDFDLETIPGYVTQEYLSKLIKELKSQNPDIIISCAPQLNNVNGKLSYVNTGTETVYNQAIQDGLFNYIFVQEYNTGGNFVDNNGNLCLGNDKNECFDQYSPEFIYNSFQALKKITPATTLIIPGQPATAEAAGAATVFHGKDAPRPYSPMANQYGRLNGDPQFGGAMTWSINQDCGSDAKTCSVGYPFVKTIKPAL